MFPAFRILKTIALYSAARAFGRSPFQEFWALSSKLLNAWTKVHYSFWYSSRLRGCLKSIRQHAGTRLIPLNPPWEGGLWFRFPLFQGGLGGIWSSIDDFSNILLKIAQNHVPKNQVLRKDRTARYDEARYFLMPKTWCPKRDAQRRLAHQEQLQSSLKSNQFKEIRQHGSSTGSTGYWSRFRRHAD